MTPDPPRPPDPRPAGRTGPPGPARPVIRLATADDAARCREIYAPAVVGSPTSFELEVPSVEEMAGRIVGTLARTPWLVLEDPDHGVLGYAYGGRHRERAAYAWTVETTVYVDPSAHGRGIGRALYTALLGVLGLQGFRLAVAGVVVPNDASIALHRALGFREVGVYHGIGWKLGRAHDVAWFERPFPGVAAAGAIAGDPPPVRVLDDVRDDPAFLAALAVPDRS